MNPQAGIQCGQNCAMIDCYHNDDVSARLTDFAEFCSIFTPHIIQRLK